jgi:hypothetical protein
VSADSGAQGSAAEPVSTGPPAQPKPEGLFTALFVIIGLVVVVGSAIAVFGLRVQNMDVMALYDDAFPGDEPIPMGLELVDGTALAGAQRWIVLRRPSATEGEDPTPELPVRVALGRMGDALPARRLFAPVAANLPRDLAKDLEKWEKEPYTFEAVTRRGTVVFDGFETDYLVMRTFEDDGTFFDRVRVDLTVGNTGGVLDAEWARDHDGAEVGVLVPLLERIELPAADPDAAPVLPVMGGTEATGS